MLQRGHAPLLRAAGKPPVRQEGSVVPRALLQPLLHPLPALIGGILHGVPAGQLVLTVRVLPPAVLHLILILQAEGFSRCQLQQLLVLQEEAKPAGQAVRDSGCGPQVPTQDSDAGSARLKNTMQDAVQSTSGNR